MSNISILFTMTNGDKHAMSLDEEIDNLDSAISRLCDLRFVHDIKTENGVTKALVINMVQVSHINIVMKDSKGEPTHA